MKKHIFVISQNRQELKINFGTNVLGRRPECNIPINEPSISSRHIMVSNFDQHVEIMDLESSNGTIVNSKKIMPFFPIRLKDGDMVTLGKLTLIYKVIEDASASSIPAPSSLSSSAIEANLSPLNTKGDVTVFAKFDPKQFLLDEMAKKQDVSIIQQNNKRLSFLYSFGQKIGSIFDLKELFQHILKEIFEMFIVADRALVFLKKDGKIRPEIFMKNGQELPITEATYSRTIVNMAISEKHGFIASDLGNMGGMDTSKSIVALNLQCTMIVPFIVDNELYGLLQLDSTKKINAFNEEDLKMLSGISNQVAVNIKNQLLINEMNQQEKVKNSLERYLGPKMVTHLIDNKINLDQKGEERFVTVLFSDIRGFTPMSEKLKPTQVIDILTEYFSRMTEVIFKYDGFIDKFIGDAIFCIFGIPLVQNNHADLAVKAAIEMQKELARINKEIFNKIDIHLNVGIGINTGNVVYGNIASMDRPEVTILGDNVNTAERLCSQAQGGQIFISESTKKLLKTPYNLENMGLFSLKGKKEQVNVIGVKY